MEMASLVQTHAFYHDDGTDLKALQPCLRSRLREGPGQPVFQPPRSVHSQTCHVAQDVVYYFFCS
jgi:hypothetical protein